MPINNPPITTDTPVKEGFFARFFGFFGIHSKTKNKMNTDNLDKDTQAYFAQLLANKEKMSNLQGIIEQAKADGITDINSQAGIAAVISKESDFVLKRENLNYTSEQLQNDFKLPKAQADILAHNPQAIANTVYMPPHNKDLGNVSPNSGWLYRGGSYNQITGEYEFDLYGKKVGVDLKANPDKIDDPEVAAKVTLAFFIDGFKTLMNTNIKKKDGTTISHKDFYNNPTGDINGFKNELDAAEAFYNINAGVGASENFLEADVTGGLKKTRARAAGFKDLLLSNQIA